MKGHINETNGTLNDWQNSVTKMWKRERQGKVQKVSVEAIKTTHQLVSLGAVFRY